MTLAAAPQTIASYYDSGPGIVHTGTRAVFGSNTERINYFGASRPFIDAMKGTNIISTSNPVPGGLDSNGYVDTSTSGSCQYITQASGVINYATGVYVLIWTGTGNCTWSAVPAFGTLTFDGPNEPSPINRREYTITTPITANVWVAQSGAVTKIELLLPGEEARHDLGNILTSQFVSDMSGVGLIRSMEFNASQESWQTDVADLAPYNHIPWNQSSSLDEFLPHYCWGAPIQAVCEVCNELAVGLWLNIPPHATDALVTEMCGQVETFLDAGLEVYIEWGNEHWNGAIDFRDFAYFSMYWDMPDQIATVDTATGICTLNDHGKVSGDEIRCYNVKEHKDSFTGWASAFQSWLDVIDVNTFYLATDSADVTGTHRPPPDVSTTNILYKDTSGDNSKHQTNYAERSMEIWALADAAITGHKVYHVAAGFSEISSFVTAMNGVSGFQEAMDFYAIAPYFKCCKDTGSDGRENWATQDYATLRNYMLPGGVASDELTSWIQNHIAALGHTRLICYEGGAHDAVINGLSVDDQAHMLGWQRSPEMGEAYNSYFKQSADLGVQLFCNYKNFGHFAYNTGCWGLMEYPGHTDSQKYAGVKEFLDNGGIPKL